jgi:hypothetical protein
MQKFEGSSTNQETKRGEETKKKTNKKLQQIQIEDYSINAGMRVVTTTLPLKILSLQTRAIGNKIACGSRLN